MLKSTKSMPTLRLLFLRKTRYDTGTQYLQFIRWFWALRTVLWTGNLRGIAFVFASSIASTTFLHRRPCPWILPMKVTTTQMI